MSGFLLIARGVYVYVSTDRYLVFSCLAGKSGFVIVG